MKSYPCGLLILLCAAPAFAASGITVNSPANGVQISLPFGVSASASSCNGQPVSGMGFSFDDSPQNTLVNGTSLNGMVSAVALGTHTLHVKSWGTGGASCVQDLSVNIVAASPNAAPAQSVNISSPSNGSQVGSPFGLTANASTCSSQPVAAMGYSFDSSPNTTIIGGNSINTQASIAAGQHTLHVKSWGNGGAGCVADVQINVAAASNGPQIPSGAISVSNIQSLGNWLTQFDAATNGGGASGTMGLVGSPSQSGHARQFVSTFWNYGGERFDVAFGDDTTSTNFLYDAWVYLDGTANQIANLELDMNQTMQNGQTAIFGFQCDGWSSTWDYTANEGSPQNPVDTWVKSNQYCNIHSWSPNTWHHVQVAYSRDGAGNVTYQSVWLDGNQQQINATVNSAFALGWQPVLLTNVQVDEQSSGWATATVYLDNVTVYRW